MTGFNLDKVAELSTVAIRVKDRDKMIDFYRDLIGFVLKGEENALAIMGTVEDNSEKIWLEESPRADDYFGETKKLQSFSVYIPTITEIAAIYARLKKAEYSVKKISIDEKSVVILLVDPEENQLEIYTEEPNSLVDEKALLDQDSAEFPSLSKNVHIKKIQLNVDDVEAQAAFLNDILGLEDNQGQFEIGEQTLKVNLTPSNSSVVQVDSDKILGLEILKFLISEETILALESHLQNLKQDFFIDKKKSILTIYDAVGVEWWFVRK